MACVAHLTFWERQIMYGFQSHRLIQADAYDTYKNQDSLKLKSAVYEVQIEMYRFIAAVIG